MENISKNCSGGGMSLVKIIKIESLGDERGNLATIEGNNNIPFDIKRAYYLFNTEKGVSRGFHAHKKLKQIAICLKGSCKFILDDGQHKDTVLLCSPLEGLFIEGMMWREIHEFSDECILLVLASEYYDEDDYIRDYLIFLKEVELNDSFVK